MTSLGSIDTYSYTFEDTGIQLTIILISLKFHSQIDSMSSDYSTYQRLLTILFAALSAITVDGQVNLYEFTPTFLNPSLTAQQGKNLNLNTIYRNQWFDILGNDSYKFLFISGSKRLELSDKFKLGIGGQFSREVAGSLNFGDTKYGIVSSITYIINQNSDYSQRVSFGLSYVYAKKRIGSGFVLRGPLDSMNGVFNPSSVIDASSVNFGDLSVGLSWEYKQFGGLEIEAGFSMDHLNKANVSFVSNRKNRLLIQKNAHASLHLPIASSLALGTTIIYREIGPHNQLFGAISSRHLINSKDDLWIEPGLIYKTGFGSLSDQSRSYGLTLTSRIKKTRIGLSWEQHNSLSADSIEIGVGFLL